VVGRVTGHHPQPLEGAGAPPGRCIPVVDRSVTCLRGDGAGVRLDGVRHTLTHFLEGPQTDRYPQHRGTKAWERASARSLDASDFPQEGAKARPIGAQAPGGAGRCWRCHRRPTTPEARQSA